MNELQKIEFEIEKVKARLFQFKRIAEVLELPDEEIQKRNNEMLDEISELLKQKEKLMK